MCRTQRVVRGDRGRLVSQPGPEKHRLDCGLGGQHLRPVQRSLSQLRPRRARRRRKTQPRAEGRWHHRRMGKQRVRSMQRPRAQRRFRRRRRG
jgi:hypothetical protein